MARNHKAAFRCRKCPANGNPDRGLSCPLWWETVWTKPDGGQEVIKSCGYEQLPLYLIEVVKASNRPAAAVESMRNQVLGGLAKFAQGFRPPGYGHKILEAGRELEKVIEDAAKPQNRSPEA
ncbi:MAG: hypothetical protein ACR2QC_07720 [Gammaproteobacteria bacterium]